MGILRLAATKAAAASGASGPVNAVSGVAGAIAGALGGVVGGTVSGKAGATVGAGGTAGAAGNSVLNALFGANDMGTWLTSVLNTFFQSIANEFITSLKAILVKVVLSPDTISSFSFVKPLYTSAQTAGFAILTLIVLWQSFKAMFVWAGFEADEPWRIAVKAVAFGFMLFYGKDILMMCVNISWNIMNLINDTSTNMSIGQQMANLMDNFALENVSLFSLNAVIMIYLIFKLVVTAFKMVERMLLSVMLIIMSPLAFAAGASAGTKGFFTGFVRVFTGNLVIQIAQTACLTAIFMFQKDMASGSIYSDFWIIFVLVGLFRLVNKLEEIVRDMSISVGMGNQMGAGLLQKASTAVYTTQSVVNIVKTISGAA